MTQQRGLTLLELLVVLAIIALASSAVALSLRDNPQTRLEREAQRLIAQLEATRAVARGNSERWVWQITPDGYRFDAPTDTMRQTANAGRPNTPPRSERWYSADTRASLQVGNDASARSLALGPDPLLAPTQIRLQQGNATLNLRTDGLRPFEVQP